MSTSDPRPPRLFDCDTATAAGQAALAEERRNSSRSSVSWPCRIIVSDGLESQRACGTVSEVSREGMLVRTSIYSVPGVLAQVLLAGSSVLGEVRHCTRVSDDCYDIGIFIQAVSGAPVSAADVARVIDHRAGER